MLLRQRKAASVLSDCEIVPAMASLDIQKDSLAGAHLGRCETGSFFKSQQAIGVEKGEVPQGGDLWTTLRPWNNNLRISTIASFERYYAMNAGTGGGGMRCTAQVKDAAIGQIFPVRGNATIGNGQFVHHMEIESIPIKSVLGVTAAHRMAAYRAYLYNNEERVAIGAVDIIPGARLLPNDKKMTADHLVALPSLGSPWVGADGEIITIDKTDVENIRNGNFCPWGLTTISVLEAAVYKLTVGKRAY